MGCVVALGRRRSREPSSGKGRRRLHLQQRQSRMGRTHPGSMSIGCSLRRASGWVVRGRAGCQKVIAQERAVLGPWIAKRVRCAHVCRRLARNVVRCARQRGKESKPCPVPSRRSFSLSLPVMEPLLLACSDSPLYPSHQRIRNPLLQYQSIIMSASLLARDVLRRSAARRGPMLRGAQPMFTRGIREWDRQVIEIDVADEVLCPIIADIENTV